MKTQYTAALALLTGIGLGAIAVQGLYAQAKPPAWVIAEIDVTNLDGFVNEYVPPAAKAILAGGGKYLARGTRTVSIKGEPPKRIVMMVFENLEQAQATFASPEFVEAANIGEKHAKFRIYAVEAGSE
jgi:uncharacterized protein (DUF1330 family)